ncbi:hypothetical protein FRB90_003968 [Tulasnella sp. 427]|nr:hypothetical protein FRB90_003968 [Tulasnella sp. 427]
MSNTSQILQARGVTIDSEDLEESLSNLIIASGSEILAQLRELTRKGWEDRRLDEHFASRIRQSAAPSTPGSEVTWIKTYCRSMREMDTLKEFVPTGFLNFLDLGCAPGGYSKYVMEKNQRAFGTGICLPVHDGGHYFILPRYQRSRYTVHYADMTKYDLLADGTNESDIPLPFRPASFHLVIADGHPLHTREFSVAVPHVLYLSQLVIALSAIKQGGTIFIKLNKLATPMTAAILYLFDSISTSLETVKPHTVHGNRGTFYAIARGIQRGQTLDRHMDVLRSMRQEFIDSPPDWNTFLRIYEQIVPFAQVKSELIPRLIELGTPVWEVQRECLAIFLLRKGVNVEDDRASQRSDSYSQGSSGEDRETV